MTMLDRTTLPARTRFEKQEVVVIAIIEIEALFGLHAFMNHCSVEGMTFLGGGGGTTSRAIFMKRSSNGRNGEDRERGREGDGRRHCTPFGKTARWRARHALARRAPRARSSTTMECLEWLKVTDVEHVLARFGRWQLSSSSSFAFFTCAIPSLRMIRTRRVLKCGTIEHQHSFSASPSTSSSSMSGHTMTALRSVFSSVCLPTNLNAAWRRRTERCYGFHLSVDSVHESTHAHTRPSRS